MPPEMTPKEIAELTRILQARRPNRGGVFYNPISLRVGEQYHYLEDLLEDTLDTLAARDATIAEQAKLIAGLEAECAERERQSRVCCLSTCQHLLSEHAEDGCYVDECECEGFDPDPEEAPDA